MKDTCDDDTRIRKLARPVLGDWIDGDSYCVPSIVDIVEKLIERIDLLVKDISFTDLTYH